MALMQYRRGHDDACPFSREPSGSEWDISHLNWLGIDFIDRCKFDVFFPPHSLIKANGDIAEKLSQRLGKPWDQIQAADRFSLSEKVYQHLKYLNSSPLESAVYSPSTPSTGSTGRTVSSRTPPRVFSAPLAAASNIGESLGHHTTFKTKQKPSYDMQKTKFSGRRLDFRRTSETNRTPERSESDTESQVSATYVSPIRLKDARGSRDDAEEPKLPSCPKISDLNTADYVQVGFPPSYPRMSHKGTTAELFLGATPSPDSSYKQTSSSPLQGDMNIQGAKMLRASDKPEEDVKQAADVFVEVVATVLMDVIRSSDLELKMNAYAT